VAAELTAARIRRRLGLREAARRAGIWHGYLSMLEHSRRCPSTLVAEAPIETLELDKDQAARLLAVAKRTPAGAPPTDQAHLCGDENGCKSIPTAEGRALPDPTSGGRGGTGRRKPAPAATAARSQGPLAYPTIRDAWDYEALRRR
jgi:hypothetical protein